MANTFILKRSSTATDVPTAGQLEQGELAINLVDEKLYSKNSSNVVFEIGTDRIGGSITDNQVAFGAATADTIEGESGFTWDGNRLQIDDISGASLKIGGGGGTGYAGFLTLSAGGSFPTPAEDIDVNIFALNEGTATHLFQRDKLNGPISLTDYHKFDYQYSSTTTSADPGAGFFRLNNAAMGSATAMYIDDLGSASVANNIYLGNLTTGDLIEIVNCEDRQEYLVLEVSSAPTDNTGWWSIPVTVVHSSAATFANLSHVTMKVQWQSQAGGSQTPWTSDIDGAGFGLDNIDRLEIQASGVATDTATFTHDGTDFNTAFANTTDWNVTGLTANLRLEGAGLSVIGDGKIVGAANTAITASINMFNDGTDGNIKTFGTAADVRFGNYGTATGYVSIEDGYSFRVFDSGTTDYVDFKHDGTNFNISATNTSYVDFIGVTTGVRFRDGVAMEIYDPTDTSWLAINHDGTDVNWVGNNTTDFILQGLTWFKFLGGAGFALYDSTNNDEMNMSHDGTDFNQNFVTTTDWNIAGLTRSIVFNDHPLDQWHGGTQGSDQIRHIRNPKGATFKVDTSSQTGAILITLPNTSALGNMSNIVIRGIDYTTTTGAWTLYLGGYDYVTNQNWNTLSSAILVGSAPFEVVKYMIDDTTDQHYIQLGTTTDTWQYPQIWISEYSCGFSGQGNANLPDGWSISQTTSETGRTATYTRHVISQYGTTNDISWDFGTATSWNITGLTDIAAGTVDADFDAVTATSFGGDGSGLTSLTAANISSGNLGSGVLPYVNAVSDSQAYKIPFVNTTGGTAGNYQLRMDSGAAPTYNPSTNVLSSITFSQNGNTVLDTSTSFGGDVSGTYNAIVVANDSHTHTFDNLTSKASGTGDYLTTGDFGAGENSGGPALTINDGYGNANLTFNHRNGTPDNTSATQSAYRIEAATDSNTATWSFEMGNSTVQDTPVALTQVMQMTTSAIDMQVNVDCNAGLDVTGSLTTNGITNSSGSVSVGNNTFSISDGTDSFSFSATSGVLSIVGTGGTSTLDWTGFQFWSNIVKMEERASAYTDTAGYGQLWVKTATPNELYFTDDAGTDLPLGYNSMPIVAISASQNFLRTQIGRMMHKNAGGAINLTTTVDSNIPTGSTWVVHNDDTEDITINTSSTTNYWLEAGSAPAAGNVTLAQGGIVTVYKAASAEFWIWGAKDAAAGGGNVSNTGTPVNNQVAVWTDATTIEGDADLTFSGTVLQVGATGTSQLVGFTAQENSGGIRMEVSTAGAGAIQQLGTTGALEDTWIDFARNGAVTLSHNNIAELQTQAHTTSQNTSGAELKDHNGTYYDVGFNVLKQQSWNSSLNLSTAGSQACGSSWGKTNTTAYTLTGPTSSQLDFPVRAVLTVMNLGTSGNLTFNDTSTCTMYHVTGSAVTDIVGTGTLGPGGIVTVYRYSASAIYIWGSGFTA